MSDERRRVALVTGASRGIGRGIAVELARLGFWVTVNYVNNLEAAKRTASLVEEVGGRAILCQADISSASDREKLLETTVDQSGPLEVLVNNVGVPVSERVDLLEASESSWDRIMDINLKGPYFLTQSVARHYVESPLSGDAPRRKIINISSVSAYASSVNRGEYCVAKAGMWMMTQVFADRLAAEGVQVFELRPGIVATDMTAPVKEKYDRLIGEGLTPIRRWGEPQDVGKAVVAIVENSFPFSTGEVFNIDGGFHMRRL